MRYSQSIENPVGAQGLRPQLYCIQPITAIQLNIKAKTESLPRIEKQYYPLSEN
jgi:hypothetical protein